MTALHSLERQETIILFRRTVKELFPLFAYTSLFSDRKDFKVYGTWIFFFLDKKPKIEYDIFQ